MSAGQVSVGDGTTVKSSVLVPVPSSVVTEILPVVAVAGTTARICVVVSTVNDAETELNFTSVVLTKLLPLMVTVLPTAPLVGVKLVILGRTVKLVVLVPVPAAVVTEIFPVVAVAGTVAVIWVSESTLK